MERFDEEVTASVAQAPKMWALGVDKENFDPSTSALATRRGLRTPPPLLDAFQEGERRRTQRSPLMDITPPREGSDGVDGQGKAKDGETASKAKDDFSFSFPSFREGKGSMGIVKATKLR